MQHKRGSEGRAKAIKAAVRAGIESLVVSVADGAAEACISRWRAHPAGTALLDRLSAGNRDEDWASSQFAADAGPILGLDMGPVRTGRGAAHRPRILLSISAAAIRQATPPLATPAVRTGRRQQVH